MLPRVAPVDMLRALALAGVLASVLLACSSGGAAGARDAEFDGPVWVPATGAACRDGGGRCITASACEVGIGGSDCGPGVACCLAPPPQVCLDASAPPIRASTYDQSCQKASECVAIGEGSVCAACLLSCPNAAINLDAKSQYMADLEKAGRLPGADGCFCTFGPAAPCCLHSMCSMTLSANVRETDARSKFSVEGEQAKAARDDIIEPSPRSPPLPDGSDVQGHEAALHRRVQEEGPCRRPTPVRSPVRSALLLRREGLYLVSPG